MAAVGTVTIALALYTVAAVKELRARRATAGVRGFFTAAVTTDIVATALMVIATGSFSATLHGMLGYSALAFMLTDTALLWRHWRRSGAAEVSPGLHLFSRLAYVYWVAAYVTGAALVMASHAARG